MPVGQTVRVDAAENALLALSDGLNNAKLHMMTFNAGYTNNLIIIKCICIARFIQELQFKVL